MDYKFKIGRANLAYNFGDANKMAAYEDALRSVSILMQSAPKDVPLSEQIRYICAGVLNMFDALFGAGTHQKIFGDTCDLVLASEAVTQLVAAQRAADDAISEELLKLREAIYPAAKK